MRPSRPLLLAALVLSPLASPRAAEPISPDVCSYLIDVRGAAKEDCSTRAGMISPETLREAAEKAPERRKLVRDLALRLSQARGADEMVAVLSTYGPKFSPPLNQRTLTAWLGPDDPLKPSDPAAKMAAAWARMTTAGPAPVAVPDSVRRSVDGLSGVSSGDAGRALDGSVVHGELADPLATGPNPPSSDPRKAPLRTPATPVAVPVSDLQAPPPPSPGLDAPGPADKPLPLVVPGDSGIHETLRSSIDPKSDPCVDFYQYACGNWIQDHPLGQMSQRSRIDDMQYRTDGQLRDIFQELSKKRPEDETSTERKLDDFFSSCMDRKAIDRLGVKPLEPFLKRIEAMSKVSDLAGVVGYLQSQGIPALFSYSGDRDAKHAADVLPEISQGGITLPRDYYLDDAHADVMKSYADYIRTMFGLIGEPKADARRHADAVLRLETALARASVPNEKLRDPEETYHHSTAESFEGSAPSFNWSGYLKGLGAPPPAGDVNVAEPSFIAGLGGLLQTVPLDDWKAYLRWQLLSTTSQDLPKDFLAANGKFWNAFWGSSGEPERWNVCVGEVGGAMGEALGEAYVRRHFDESAKKAITDLATAIKAALKEDIGNASWMSPETKELALAKAEAMTMKVGYPDHPTDFGRLGVARGDAFGNARHASTFALQRNLASIGKPVDKSEWAMPAQTVNAYYSAENNEIVFPAAFLQPPFFDPKAGAALNYGAIGIVIGHEMTHGFDDNGRRFDKDGNMSDWWTSKDAASFQSLAGAFVAQYSAYPQVPGKPLPVNGKLTLGETIADNGGMHLAYAAFLKSPGDKTGSDGFTPEQTFFLSFGRASCTNQTDQTAEIDAAADTHPPYRVRVNGAVSNMPEFRAAFKCAEGSPMANKTPARVW